MTKLEIDPKHGDAWNSKGVALDNLGKYENAIKSYKEAIRIEPDYADAWYNTSRLKIKIGDIDNAISNLEK